MADTDTLPNIATHGAERLPSVTVDSYNVELKDDEGFIGDRASKGAFRDMIENWRKPLRKAGEDPFGDTPSEEISKKTFDVPPRQRRPGGCGIVQGAIEDFSQELALVIPALSQAKGMEGYRARCGWRRFPGQPGWRTGYRAYCCDPKSGQGHH